MKKLIFIAILVLALFQIANAQIQIRERQLPVVNAGLDQTVCEGSNAVLNGSVTGDVTTGVWTTTGDGVFNPGATTLTATYIPSANDISNGSVILTLTADDPAGPCGVVADQMVLMINPIVLVNAGLDQTVCEGGNVVLNGSVTGGTTNGTWTTSGDGSFSPNATTLTATYIPGTNDISNGSALLTLTSNDPAGPCGVVADQMIVTINPVVLVNAGLDQTVCEGESVNLNGTISGGVITGTWTGGTGNYNPGATALNVVYTPSAAEVAAGTVTLTLTSDDPAGPCGAVSDQMVIVINPVVVVNAGLDQTVCEGVNVVLNGSITGGTTNGTWTTSGDGSFSPNATTLTATYIPGTNDISNGTAILTLTSDDPAGPCSVVTDQMIVMINPIVLVNAGIDQSMCAGTSVTLNGSITGGIGTGTWTGGTGTYNPGATALNVVYTPSAAEVAAGTVTLTLTSDDPAGPCSVVTDDVVITINPLPIAYTVTLDGVTAMYGEYCAGQPGVQVGLTGSQLNYTYQLQYYIVPNTNVGSSVNGTGGAIFFPPALEEDYRILMVSPFGCTGIID